MPLSKLLLSLLALVAIATAPLMAEDTAAPAETGAQAQQPTNIFKWPYVNVDKSKNEVRVDCELSPGLRGTRAALEFLLISGFQDKETKEWGWDRDYESVFVTKADPNIIHVALMLIGLKPGELPQHAPEGYSKDNSERVGQEVKNGGDKDKVASMVDIYVEWKEGDETKTMRAEKFVFDREAKDAAKDTPFAFTGSYFVTNEAGKKVIAASETYVVAAVFNDESAILNLPYFAKNGHWGDDVGMELNSEHLPPYFRKAKTIISGTTPMEIQIPVQHPVTLIFKPSRIKAPETQEATKEPAKPAEEKTEPQKSDDSAKE
ncbi:MAG: hypothetical protein JXR97_11790 [Planctomycetes bacterium]|nr:hypothetical protein [Planctomycetota bacterium]